MSQTIGHPKGCGQTSMRATLTACPLVTHAVIAVIPVE